MKDLAEPVKWLLEKDIRAKNATSFLAGLVAIVSCYFVSRGSSWLEDVERYGPAGVAAAYVIVFLIAFFVVWLAWSGMAAHVHRGASIRNAQQERMLATQRAKRELEQREQLLRGNLDKLTEWQRQFLLRFLVEGRRQIPEFEVGAYKATWDFEMAVLIEKRVIIHHRGGGGVYEIAPAYHDYLQEHWNAETGNLE